MAAPKTIVQMQRLGRFGRSLKTSDPRARAMSRVREARRRAGRWATRPVAPR